MIRFNTETLSLGEPIFTLLRDLIHERTGQYYDSKRRQMVAEKLSPLVIELGLTSFLDYYYFLKYDVHADREWIRLIDAVSVQETFFWREMDQVRALVDELMPLFLDLSPYKTVRIWSAACATGEEALSIAMALLEGGWFNRLPIEIHGSDASQSAIDRARSGRYRERAFRNLPESLRKKYFERRDGFWHVSPELHSKITWSRANLVVEDDVVPLAGASVIYCRNAFIYFSETTIRKTVELFHRNMPSPGYLFVGASESLFKISEEFELQEIGGAFVYVKR